MMLITQCTHDIAISDDGHGSVVLVSHLPHEADLGQKSSMEPGAGAEHKQRRQQIVGCSLEHDHATTFPAQAATHLFNLL